MTDWLALNLCSNVTVTKHTVCVVGMAVALVAPLCLYPQASVEYVSWGYVATLLEVACWVLIAHFNAGTLTRALATTHLWIFGLLV